MFATIVYPTITTMKIDVEEKGKYGGGDSDETDTGGIMYALYL